MTGWELITFNSGLGIFLVPLPVWVLIAGFVLGSPFGLYFGRGKKTGTR